MKGRQKKKKTQGENVKEEKNKMTETLEGKKVTETLEGKKNSLETELGEGRKCGRAFSSKF